MVTAASSSDPSRLVFALHFHQPYGNLDEVFHDAMDRCYLRTLAILRDHPRVKSAIHVSGPLLDWAEAHRPTFIDELRHLVERDQVEVLGGGYQEPMLAILPDRDAIGQLVRMADRCETLLGRRPRGMWLTERVWEPDLARVIATAGYRYTLLDDSHLRAAGAQTPLEAYYVTDKAGQSVAVFPIDYGLRTRIPFAGVDDLVSYLQEQRGRVAVYGDDVEKFGLWPTTERRVWGERWLERFLHAVEENEASIRTVNPSRVLEDTPSGGSVYIPTISYMEMGAWALPADASNRFNAIGERMRLSGYNEETESFLRGGIWQAFLAKYPESNLIYRKMLRVSEKVQQAAERGDPKADEARHALYQGQCNCAYWHGLFGGLYLQHLRVALMEALLRAEELIDPREHVRLEESDYDGDLADELIIESPRYDLVVSPKRGGSGLSLELRKGHVHLTGVLGRRREAYHVDVPRARVVSDEELGNVSAHDLVRATEDGLADKLRYDGFPRGAFVDHLLPADATVEDMNRYAPVADFANAVFTLAKTGVHEREVSARLEARHGGHQLKKGITARNEAIDVTYELQAEGLPADGARFASQLDVTLLTPQTVGGRRFEVDGDPAVEIPGYEELPDDAPGAARTHDNVRAVRIVAESMGVDVTVSFEPAATLWRLPIETVSQSERGFERAYQGTSLVASWPVESRLSAKVRVTVD